MAAPLYVTQSGRLWHAGLILIVTVGLPGELLQSIAHECQLISMIHLQLEARHTSQELLNGT